VDAMEARTPMNTFDVLTLVAALACGLAAGFFFAFSICIMQALGKIPAPQGIAAMQSINVVVLNPLFLGVFVGTAMVCVLGLIDSLVRWQTPGAAYVLAGSALYLVGTFLVTRVFNVPRNDALASVVPSDPSSAAIWAGYVSSWTAWNHVRTAAALAAAASFSIALAG
jgi:uncharacterized membrane protein